ncbi:unnamed protein product [Psylliodes chrysocephalus]|uniref:Uncharacterized protein n=1 Tax=Psylliodes chrysocephalus TaxID=3402493 RepID=A0A9P0CVD9_9CUCU|nr:unnamed protein product [Psylliodes chrysocephala]
MISTNSSIHLILTEFLLLCIILPPFQHASDMLAVNSKPYKIPTNFNNKIKRDISIIEDVDLETTNITFNKCCKEDELLDFRSTCDNQKLNDFQQSDFVSILESFVIDEKLQPTRISTSRISLKYNYLEKLRKDNAVVFSWSVEQKLSEALYVFSIKDGSLLELDRKNSSIIHSFSSESYCLDNNDYFHRNIVAFINPCIDYLCIKKCCAKNHFYNTHFKDCYIDELMNPPKLKFYFMTSPSTSTIQYYFMYGLPNCSKNVSRKMIKNDNDAPLYIQEDGFLLTVDEKANSFLYYNNNSFCTDLFSDGKNKEVFNGLYCSEEYISSIPIAIDMKALFGDTTKVPEQTQKLNKTIKTKMKLLNVNRSYFIANKNEYLMDKLKPKGLSNRVSFQRNILICLLTVILFYNT